MNILQKTALHMTMVCIHSCHAYGHAYSYYHTWPNWSTILYTYIYAWCFILVVEHQSYSKSYHYISFLYKDILLSKALMLSMANMNHVFKHLGICMHFAPRSQYLVGQYQVIMALSFNDNHIIYYHMNAQHYIG